MQLLQDTTNAYSQLPDSQSVYALMALEVTHWKFMPRFLSGQLRKRTQSALINFSLQQASLAIWFGGSGCDWGFLVEHNSLVDMHFSWLPYEQMSSWNLFTRRPLPSVKRASPGEVRCVCRTWYLSETYLFVLWGNPQPLSDPPHSQNGTMAKDALRVRKVYWGRERAHDKTGERVVFVVCTVGAFIGCVVEIKSE